VLEQATFAPSKQTLSYLLTVRGQLIVITGPSGVGKGTLLAILRGRMPELYYSVSATTRDPRPGERPEEDYYFIDKKSFEQKIEEEQFVEYAKYSEDYYGTLYQEIERPLEDGRPVILEIELQGARQIKKAFPAAHMVFIKPPSMETLNQRLQGRATDSAEAIRRRLAAAETEIEALHEFEYCVENDDLDQAALELQTVIEDIKAKS
jgi:guanylate kinase